MQDSDRSEPSAFALHRIPNGLVVLLAVALLLQGPVGAFEALWGYTTSLLASLLGGEELFIEVICQAAPLVFAAAAIAILCRSRRYAPSDPRLWLVSSMMLLAATWLGGELRSMTAHSRHDGKSRVAVTAESAQGDIRMVSLSRPSAEDSLADPETISVQEAFRRLSDLQTAATDGSHHRWTEKIPRVDLVPETGAVPGILAQSVNQVLGYLVVYRPRLFFAAILLGAYLGWSWQPPMKSLRCWLLNRTRKTTGLESP